jgi:hypothetical protein
MGPTHFTLRMVTVPQLVNVVRPYLETNHVVDHTGLTGQYDIKVMFSTGTGPSGPAAAADPQRNDATEPAPDIFSAFEKQLGLNPRALFPRASLRLLWLVHPPDSAVLIEIACASPRPSIGEASELGGVDCKRPWQPHHKVMLFSRVMKK